MGDEPDQRPAQDPPPPAAGPGPAGTPRRLPAWPPPAGTGPWGPPVGAPAPGSRRAPVVAGAAGAILAALVVLAALVTVLPAGDGGGNRPGRAAAAKRDTAPAELAGAATDLAENPAVRYRGTITSALGAPTEVDLRVANGGSTHGTLTQNGKKLQLLAVDDKIYFKGDKAFWRAGGAPADSVGEYAKQWVKVPPDKLGVDVEKLLAPAELGRGLGTAATAGHVTSGGPATVGGLAVKRLSTPEWTLYVTAAEPRRIVRIERAPAAGVPVPPQPPGLPDLPDLPDPPSPPDLPPPPGMQPAAQRAPGGDLRLDLADLSPDEADDLFEKLADRVRELKNSIDSQVRFSLTGAVRLAPCGTTGCTAHVTLRNSVSTPTPDLRADGPVTAAITISMTLDGRPIRTCTTTEKMRPNGSASATCHASYYIPPSRNPRTHYVRALARAVARTVVAADIKRIVADLKKEQQAARRGDQCLNLFGSGFAPPPAPGGGAVPVSDPTPSARCDEPPPSLKRLIKKEGLPTSGRIRYVPPPYVTANTPRLPTGPGGRGFVDRFGNVWVKGPVRSQKAIQSGATMEWDVQLTKAAARRFRWLCERERKNNINHLNVTEKGEISHVVCF